MDSEKLLIIRGEKYVDLLLFSLLIKLTRSEQENSLSVRKFVFWEPRYFVKLEVEA